MKKTIGVAPDSSLIRSASVAPVNPGTRIADYPDLVDVNGSKFSLPSDAPEPWVLAFHSLQCGGCQQQLPGYRKFLVEQGIPRERAVSIVAGERSELEWLVDGLGSAGRVVHVEEDAQILLDLQIATWPVYLLVGRDSTVIHSTQSAARLSTFQLNRLSGTADPAWIEQA
ncbi:hypothetical protein OG345_13615 [Streptomyces sp. NBC_01220]|uniref:hypothetical protein n=1 Tax=unclassified Streptomyces TaxID=2593676 RepID=UPI00343F9262|nr:hypothetical protein OG345_13615 [Streptomyces sp. NBC_01220]